MSSKQWMEANGNKQASNDMGEMTGRSWREAQENGTLCWNEAGNPFDNDDSLLVRQSYRPCNCGSGQPSTSCNAGSPYCG